MNKTAVVTGGSGGIGQAITLHLLRAGFQVIALYYTHEDAMLQLSKEALEKNLGQTPFLFPVPFLRFTVCITMWISWYAHRESPVFVCSLKQMKRNGIESSISI